MMIRLLRKAIGIKRYTSLRQGYYAYLQAMDTLRRENDAESQFLLDPRWERSCHRLWSFSNKYYGHRAFLLGNGPSLNKTDLSKLNNEITFGTNRVYLLTDKTGFTPTHYVCVNPNVTEQFGKEIDRLTVPKFIDWNCRDHVTFDDHTAFFRSLTDPMFSTRPVNGLYQGNTVTYAAMQLAYFMGITTLILIGVDHFFSTKGEPNKLVESKSDDVNHFAPEYFGKGVRWQLPDLERSEFAYRMARFRYERSERKILDATIGGCLQVFDKVDYDSLFT